MAETFVLNGTFEKTPFPALLMQLKDSGKAGLLVIKEAKVEKRIFFQDGEPVGSRSNVRKDLIGELLCKRGKISKAQLDEAILESRKEGSDNFGQIVVNKGFISPKEFYSECKYQFVSILFGLFQWESGGFSFEEEDVSTLIPTDIPKFHIKFSKLLSEGIRLVKNEDLIDRMLGDAGQRVVPGSVSIMSQDLSFKGAEKPIMDLLGEARSIQSIIDEAAMDSFMAKKILSVLSYLGVVEVQAAIPEAEPEGEETLPGDSEEELPSLSETSLSAFMSDLIPEERTPELPVFEEEAPEVSDIEALAPAADEESEFLPTHMEVPAEEEMRMASQKIEFAIDEAADGPEVEHEKETDDIEAFPEEPTFEESGPWEEEKAETIEASEPSGIGEEPAAAVKDEALPAEQEGTLMEAIEKERAQVTPPEEEPVPEEEAETAGKEDDLPSEHEEAVEESRPFMKTEGVKKRKSFPLVLASVFLGLLVVFGGLALFYFHKARESQVMVVAEQESVETKQEEAAVKTPEEIIQELAQEEVGETSPVTPVLPADEKNVESPTPEAGSVPPSAEKPDSAQKPAVEKPAVEEPAGETQKSVEKKEEKPPAEIPAEKQKKKEAASEPAPPWRDLYIKGLASFREGNLKSAFKSWSEVIRAAPDSSYSIQIEVTSYLNYASRDIQEASPEEAVFIVNTTFKEKPAYKVLCGIYENRVKAEEAIQGLSPYLKAQNPALVRVERLKAKLID